LPIAKQHYKLTLADILGAHERALTFGGLAGIRDIGTVEAAITRPYIGYYKKIEEKAAAIVESVAAHHGFVDGNKRTALYLLNLLLLKSGYQLVPMAGEDLNRAVEMMIVDVVERRLNKHEATDWLKQRVCKNQ
jgi:death-on-curing protein